MTHSSAWVCLELRGFCLRDLGWQLVQARRPGLAAGTDPRPMVAEGET